MIPGASFEIKGRFEDTNGDGAIDNKDEEGTDKFH